MSLLPNQRDSHSILPAGVFCSSNILKTFIHTLFKPKSLTFTTT